VHWNQVSDECIQGVTHEYKLTLDEMLTQVDQLRDALRGSWTSIAR
jgi:hypothetical protein